MEIPGICLISFLFLPSFIEISNIPANVSATEVNQTELQQELNKLYEKVYFYSKFSIY